MCDSSRFGRARGIRDHGPAMVRVSHTEYLVAERVIYVCHVERMRKVQTRETVEIHHDRYQQLILPTRARVYTQTRVLLRLPFCHGVPVLIVDAASLPMLLAKNEIAELF
jgi:hypothetical protein